MFFSNYSVNASSIRFVFTNITSSYAAETCWSWLEGTLERSVVSPICLRTSGFWRVVLVGDPCRVQVVHSKCWWVCSVAGGQEMVRYHVPFVRLPSPVQKARIPLWSCLDDFSATGLNLQGHSTVMLVKVWTFLLTFEDSADFLLHPRLCDLSQPLFLTTSP